MDKIESLINEMMYDVKHVADFYKYNEDPQLIIERLKEGKYYAEIRVEDEEWDSASEKGLYETLVALKKELDKGFEDDRDYQKYCHDWYEADKYAHGE